MIFDLTDGKINGKSKQIWEAFMDQENQTLHKRRVRYKGKYPKKFEEKWRRLFRGARGRKIWKGNFQTLPVDERGVHPLQFVLPTDEVGFIKRWNELEFNCCKENKLVEKWAATKARSVYE